MPAPAKLLPAALSILFFADGAVAQCDTPFSPENIPVGDSPRLPRLADFNGDGIPDVAFLTGSGTNSAVAVGLNDGSGAYGSILTYPAAEGSRHLVVGDLNGDSRADAATISANASELSILLNNGDGTLAVAVAYPLIGAGVWVELGDVDDDGDLDVITSNGSANSVTIFLNDGTGGLSEFNTFSTIGYPYSISTDDLDGDGLLDLSIAAAVDVAPAGGGESVLLFPNLGFTDDTWNGYTPWLLTPDTYIEIASAPFEVVTAELDGLPGVDVGIINAVSRTVSVAFNHGDGTFGPDTEYADNLPQNLAFADLDDDGDNDMYYANFASQTEGLVMRANDSTGMFGPPQPLFTSGRTNGFSIGDFDGDGDADVMAADADGDTLIPLINSGQGVFDELPQRFAIGDGPWEVNLEDMDLDGYLDLVARCPGTGAVSGITVALNHGDGTFQPPVGDLESVASRHMRIGDVNGDDYPDVVCHKYVAENDSLLSVRINGGDGTLLPEVTTPLTGTFAKDIGLADLDDDGDLDLVFEYDIGTPSGGGGTSYTYHMGFRLNDGVGNFANETSFQMSPPGWGLLYMVDVNGDDRADIIHGGNLLKVGVRLNNGDGTWSPLDQYAVGSFSQDMEVRDFDGDGDVDFVVANRLDANIGVLLNDGRGAFAPMVTYDFPGDPFSIASGDVDGDGDLDISAPYFSSQNPGMDKVAVMLNNGDATFGDTLIYDAGVRPYYTAMGDLNGDGTVDLVVPSNADDDALIYLNTCAAAAPACPADCSPAEGNGLVNIDDLLAVVNAFGSGAGPCDIAPDNGDGTFGNGTVNIDDLLTVVNAFGPCPR